MFYSYQAQIFQVLEVKSKWIQYEPIQDRQLEVTCG